MNHELTTTGVQEVEGEALLGLTEKLNSLSEVSQVALGVGLVRVKETEAFKERGYESFDEWYKVVLRRSKGDISRLMTVGRFMIDGGFHEEKDAAPYTVLYTAIKAFPDKDPAYVLASAQSNSISEILDNRRDDAFGPDHTHTLEEQLYKRCGECGKMERV